VNAIIGVSQARRNALIAANQAVPNGVPVLGLIDTGASCTCVDPSVLNALNLTPTGSASVNTPTTGAQPAVADQYDVGLVIPSASGSPPLFHHTIAVVKADLLIAQGFHALIGRDVLRGCLLTYDGKTGLFTLAY
jgi:Aspartyl protease